MLTLLRLAVLTLLAGGFVAVGPPAATAADDCGRTGCDGSVETSGNSVVVTVTGTLVRGGSAGSSSSTTVSIPTPCYLMATVSGKELAEDIERNDGMVLGDDRQFVPAEQYWPGWEDHADDDVGRWYVPVCDLGVTDPPPTDAFMNDFFDRTDSTFVEEGETPPTPPIPPEILLAAAQEALAVPDPRFDLNPRRGGAASTVVNLDTWFWMLDPTDSGSVTASAGGNSVTVNLARESVVFSSANAGSVSCDDGGVAWSPGASSDCTLTFRRSGAGQSVDATTRWVGTWSFNGAEQGAVDPVVATWSDAIAVAEIQSVVTGVS